MRGARALHERRIGGRTPHEGIPVVRRAGREALGREHASDLFAVMLRGVLGAEEQKPPRKFREEHLRLRLRKRRALP